MQKHSYAKDSLFSEESFDMKLTRVPDAEGPKDN